MNYEQIIKSDIEIEDALLFGNKPSKEEIIQYLDDILAYITVKRNVTELSHCLSLFRKWKTNLFHFYHIIYDQKRKRSHSHFSESRFLDLYNTINTQKLCQIKKIEMFFLDRFNTFGYEVNDIESSKKKERLSIIEAKQKTESQKEKKRGEGNRKNTFEQTANKFFDIHDSENFQTICGFVCKKI